MPVPALTDHLGYWMRLVSNHVSFAFARLLEGKGVTVAEWVVLRELHDQDDIPPSRLAERMGMTRGAISRLADRLLDKALIARTDSPDDARSHTLRLTRQGRALVPELARLADENDAAFFGHLAPAQRAAMRDALQEIARRKGLKDIPVA